MKRASLLLVLAAAAAAASAMSPGDKAGLFLTLPQGARPTAMGEAFCAVTGDVYSSHWNPAGLADVGRMTVTASMAPTYLDMYYGYVAGAMAFGRNAVSLALSNFDYGDLAGYDEHARNPTTFTASDLAVAASYGRRFPRWRLTAGASVKLLREKIEQESATAVMLDLGAVKRFNRLTLGAALRNLGPGMTFHDGSAGLPAAASLGATYYLATLPLVPAVSVELPLDDLPVLSLGAEYTAWNLLALRAGLRSDRDAGWPSWLRFGLGVTARGISVDYAAIPGQEIGATHMISLSYRR